MGIIRRISIPSSNGNVDIKALLPEVWDKLTTENFAFSVCAASCSANKKDSSLLGSTLSVSTGLSYNSASGILTISGNVSSSYTWNSAVTTLSITRSIVCYYYE